ncbi:hypothetical protein PUN28_010602 [Cardiocondyla obscurior]|uniref:Uncharacterized protein n=1 Tax=Cardiocondyla obscurior TaxID=286306 RepID=A0AAW2FH06_9HYME
MQSGLPTLEVTAKGGRYVNTSVTGAYKRVKDKDGGKTVSYLASYLNENNLSDCSTLIPPGTSAGQKTGHNAGKSVEYGTVFRSGDERIVLSLTVENLGNDVAGDCVVNAMLLY